MASKQSLSLLTVMITGVPFRSVCVCVCVCVCVLACPGCSLSALLLFGTAILLVHLRIFMSTPQIVSGVSYFPKEPWFLLEKNAT